MIDGKRATNVAIAIARIKYNYGEIREHIRSLNEQAFSLEQLNSIKDSLPTDDEIKTLKSFAGDTTRLGEVGTCASRAMPWSAPMQTLDGMCCDVMWPRLICGCRRRSS